MTERTIVIADPPTPNGDLHVGHLAGPYFTADALTRSLRLRGKRVAFLSNFDSNQPYVATAARKLGMGIDEIRGHFTGRIAASLAANAIEPDLIGSPDARQSAFVQRFFGDLHARGKLAVKDHPMPYCETCDRFLFEAYLQGTCPHCGALTYGNGCEGCSLPNDPAEMGDRLCRLCGEPPAGLRTYRGLFLPLERYRAELTALLRSRAGRSAGCNRQQALDLVLAALERPLPDVPLSYVSDYGLGVEIPGLAGQIYNVRQEIQPALVATFDRWRAAQPGGGWDWRDGEPYETVVCHGYENSFQYMLSFNALLLASPLGWKPPYADLTNEFYLLDGKKFSTTRRHAVWGADILARVPSDHLRFYLALTNPECEQTNFALAEFREATDRLLTGPWNEVARRLGTALARRRSRARAAALPDGFAERRAGFAAEMAAAYDVDTFSLRRAAAATAGWLAALAAEAAALEAGGDAERAERGLAAVLAGTRALALFAAPLMPRWTARLRERLGIADCWDRYAQPLDPRAVRWGEGLCLPPLADVDLSF